jgi:hypothetical protein
MLIYVSTLIPEVHACAGAQTLRCVCATPFSTRFSSTYVDDLFKKAGSSNIDLKKLSLYVQGQCRYR